MMIYNKSILIIIIIIIIMIIGTCTIMKRFEFDHARMTMSVIVRDDKGQVIGWAVTT